MANTETITVNSEVRRVGSGDYAEGRQGTVLEANDAAQRARVLWHTSPKGEPLFPKPIRTWVKFEGIQIVKAVA